MYDVCHTVLDENIQDFNLWDIEKLRTSIKMKEV